ncbi:MAG TPA: DUF3147 family protein [Candidatus Poseidoniales archaeon]|nr:DUF3147 family protein [Candidatus Poseidoniales archaeon]
MAWWNLVVKGVLSGTIIVASSEIAERSALYGALIISLPIASILAVVWLYHDTGDLGQVADYAGSILWLVLPSLVLFIVLPGLLRAGWEFWPALGAGIVATVITYVIGMWLAQSMGTPT